MSNKQILLVEDDALSRLALREQLEYSDLGKVLEAKNDKEVFEHLSGNPVDVILMDVRLKGSLTGIEITKMINFQQFDIPVIFITGNSDQATFNEILQTGPHAVLDKPVELSILRNSILTAYAKQAAPVIPKPSDISSDQILSLIYETAKVGMCVTDSTGTFVRVNKAYCDNYGYRDDEIVGKNFTMMVPAEHRQLAQQMHDDFIAEKITELPADWQVKTKDDQIKEVFVTAGRLVNTDGSVFKITTVTDVTERNMHVRSLEKSLQEREFFEKEIFHRVKNNLNMVVSLFQMQRTRVKGDTKAKEVLTAGISRVRSLALLHERLYKQEEVLSINMLSYIQELIRFLFDDSSLAGKVQVDVIDFECDVDTAVSVGLIINELLTNVIKHAFESSDAEPDVKLSISDQQDSFLLTVSDNGVPVSDDFIEKRSNSLGIQMIMSLTGQLGGSFDFKNEEDYKKFLIRFPKP